MSLKALHIVFVTASILLALGFGVWEVRAYGDTKQRIDLWMGVGSFVTAVALLWYGKVVLRKLRHISYL